MTIFSWPNFQLNFAPLWGNIQGVTSHNHLLMTNLQLRIVRLQEFLTCLIFVVSCRVICCELWGPGAADAGSVQSEHLTV